MFRDILNDKIGNLVCYIAEKTPQLSLTKLLKLLYIIDERSIMSIGSPITWLEYKAWAEGPVAEDIYNEVKNRARIEIAGKNLNLDEFITVFRQENKERKQEEIFIKNKKASSLHEFSRVEKEIINDVLREFGKLPANRLIDILHTEGGVWDKTVRRNNLENDFINFGKKSTVTLHMSELIEHDEILMLSMKSSYESLAFHGKMC